MEDAERAQAIEDVKRFMQRGASLFEGGATFNARDLLEDSIGVTVYTPRGEPNTILGVEDDSVIVATRRSPQGQPVPIEDVQKGFDLLARDLVVEVNPEILGYRSSFVGAFLAHIWGEDTVLEDPDRVYISPEPPLDDEEVGGDQQRSLVQGRTSDVLLRQAVELRAVEEATRHWESKGWEVEDVGAVESYDLRCLKDGRELHVEVKGTSGPGSRVILTRNEVNHAREYPQVALFILQEIDVNRDGEIPTASGGTQLIFNPWDIDEGTLECERYLYSSPGQT